MTEHDEDAPDEVLNAPPRIWLNVGYLDGPIDMQKADLQHITWSNIRQAPDDVEYVRADLAAQ